MKLAVAALAIVTALQTPTAEEIASRLHGYLLAYEPKLSELIADERMRQQDLPGVEVRGDSQPHYVRTLQSEVAFVALPGAAGWLGFRRVLKVDKDDVADGAGSLREVLSSGAKDDYQKAKELLADGARFNLGEPRTINLPNLPLEMLHPRHAKRFSVRTTGQESVRGTRTTRLVFVETFSPTIIKATDGGDMRSIITAWVEPATGRLLRADVITRDPRPGAGAFDNVVAVRFKEHTELGLLVPDTMREEFFAGKGRRAWGEASYTNYRRFTTSARILPQ